MDDYDTNLYYRNHHRNNVCYVKIYRKLNEKENETN